MAKRGVAKRGMAKKGMARRSVFRITGILRNVSCRGVVLRGKA